MKWKVIILLALLVISVGCYEQDEIDKVTGLCIDSPRGTLYLSKSVNLDLPDGTRIVNCTEWNKYYWEVEKRGSLLVATPKRQAR